MQLIKYLLIPLQTNLEAIAVKVMFPEPCTICSIYIPPDTNLNYNEIDQLIKSLPSPFILTGDFNAYSPIWNSPPNTLTNPRGRVIEEVLDTQILLNTGLPTHFSARQGTFSTIDLTICDTKIAANLQWDVLPSLHGSDHFPLVIYNLLKNKNKPLTNYKWKFKDADWLTFTTELNKFNISITTDTNIDTLIEQFTKKIIEVASVTIRRRKPLNNKTSTLVEQTLPRGNKKYQSSPL